MSNEWLSNKKIVIIGGTAGLGLSAALACIAEGARVVVVGRNAAQGEEAAALFKEHGKVITGDATDENTAEGAIRACLDHFGGFDALYHVAGGSGRKFGDGPMHELSLEGWNYTMGINLTSLMLSNRAALRYFMSKQMGGVILNMGSILGSNPSYKYFSTHAYAAAKAAVTGMSRSLAAYYAPHNIRVNAIVPALVETPMSQRATQDDEIMSFIRTKQPLDGGRIGIPSDLDGAAVFLLSDRSKFVTGQVLAIDGGWSVSEGQF